MVWSVRNYPGQVYKYQIPLFPLQNALYPCFCKNVLPRGGFPFTIGVTVDIGITEGLFTIEVLPYMVLAAASVICLDFCVAH